ncbi:hypothetical protein [Rhizosaccharibacter radicis]|uniref:BON domain-containing protein n=1 Tax=Rhizosaccharibacter radicis TaxID=2782605 RepID=A0ABT1VU85_9PROT|nr:hypothetical protein [Acetobacteraceae bacterium KSS12]
MTDLTPFADESSSSSIGKLTIENAGDRVSLYGSLDITRDQHGLDVARQLKALLDKTVGVLEASRSLPKQLPRSAEPARTANPFE